MSTQYAAYAPAYADPPAPEWPAITPATCRAATASQLTARSIGHYQHRADTFAWAEEANCLLTELHARLFGSEPEWIRYAYADCYSHLTAAQREIATQTAG